ncbi:MAG: hypothetical protein R3249_07835 [Nitriliruptorales bacterium]|nr:hypothetical protein [Nitriliruptorales bacterium]
MTVATVTAVLDHHDGRIRRLWIRLATSVGATAAAFVSSVVVLMNCVALFGGPSPCPGDGWDDLAAVLFVAALVGALVAVTVVVRLVIAYRARARG